MKKVMIEILKKCTVLIGIIFIFIVFNMYFLTYPPKIIGEMIDLLEDAQGNRSFIIEKIYSLMRVTVLLLVIRLPWRSLSSFAARTFEKELKDKLFNQFLRIKMTNLQNIKNGEIMSYFTKDVSEIRQFFYRVISYATRTVAILVIATYTMVSGVDIKLTILTLCPVVVTAFIIVKIKRYVELNFKKSQKHFTELSEYVQECTDAIRTTKAYSGETNQLKEFIRKNKILKSSNNAVDVHSTLLSTCTKICFGLCYGISLIYGSKLVLENQITIGEFTAFNGYISLFVGPIDWLPGIISRFKRAQIAYQRLDVFFSLEREKIFPQNDGEKDKLIAGDIQIKDLSFNYPENIEVALKHIYLDIKQGQTLGVIGTIGSGKTTLMNLLVKLYPVKRGKIMIGGQDINDIPITTLRKSICYITQDNFLFSTTLKDNISLFKENLSDDDIRESTKNAMIYDEISHMKNGIYTEIGERGTDLSGGQRQRVAISRAFLGRSNIVIFDDTFSALDNRTEKRVLENVQEMSKEKTCIIVSNRISDIKDADRIIVLDDGEIVEAGRHDSLLKQKGLYYRFYMQQSSQEQGASEVSAH